MPEGHTLHRLARTLNRRLGGHQVRSSSPQGRFAAGAAAVDGRVLTRADAWGKHLLVSFADVPEQVHVHLGLYGKLALSGLGEGGEVLPAVGQVRWRLVGDDVLADLRGPTACELLGPDEVGLLVDRLGPDPLRRNPRPERAWGKVSRSRAPIATLLMDQSVVAGIGNVYRAELLYRHHLDPWTPGHDLDRPTWDALCDDLVHLMRIGVRRGRIDTLRPEHEPLRARGAKRNYVYRRAGEPCLVCGTVVRTEVLATRNLFWCPTCQGTDSLRG